MFGDTKTCSCNSALTSLFSGFSTNEDLFDAKYDLLQFIGRGGSSSVYKCMRKQDKKFFAVKKFTKFNLRHKEMTALEKEIQILKYFKNITHGEKPTGLPQLIEIIYSAKYIHVILELCGKYNLFEIASISIKKGMSNYKKEFDEKLISNIIFKISRTLNYIHKHNIVHRDLKLDNILFKHNKYIVKNLIVNDFGLASYLKNEGLTSKCGSPTYVAPEVLDNEYYGKECDYWSLGVILFILLSGQYPFMGENLSELYKLISKGKYNFKSDEWKLVSDDAKDLVKKLLVVDPKKRYGYSQIASHPFITKHLSKIKSV